jgi:LPXTG-motif cell wall-anchored protein
VGTFAVRKVLDAADVQGARDMSGFVFEVTDTDGGSFGQLTTGSDGRTPPLEALAGTYTISEVSSPPWASGLTGAPVSFDVETDHDPGADDHDGIEIATLEVTYVNVVPAAAITTSATDLRDGDRVVDLADGDATIVDTVTYTGLVPGTEYTAIGELMVRPFGPAQEAATANDAQIDIAVDSSGASVASSTVAMPLMVPSGIVGSTTFVPSGPDGQVDVAIAVPADSPLLGHTVVVYQRLVIAASERTVAVHADPAAIEQTIRFVTVDPPPAPTTTIPTTIPAIELPPTTTTTTTSTTSTIVAAQASPPAPGTTSRLPRTGGDGGRSMALGGLALLLVGAGLVLAARATPSPPDTSVPGRSRR